MPLRERGGIQARCHWGLIIRPESILCHSWEKKEKCEVASVDDRGIRAIWKAGPALGLVVPVTHSISGWDSDHFWSPRVLHGSKVCVY